MRIATGNITAAPRCAAMLWLSVLAAFWQIAIARPSLAEDPQLAIQPATQPEAEHVVVVDPLAPAAAPRLLYALDAGHMSMSELRPGTTDRGQLSVYLSMLDAPINRQAAMANPTLVMVAMLQQQAGGNDEATIQTASATEYSTLGVMPRSFIDGDGTWVFPRQPGSDERDLLGYEKWRVEENPESQALFLGPDRVFGFDDFLDLVNPLQHIPLVNLAYRAVTGDEIYGAARLLDAGFGPAAGVSTVFDLALTDTTGSSMEDHAMAALFGPADEPGTADLAQVPVDEGQQYADLRNQRRGSNQ